MAFYCSPTWSWASMQLHIEGTAIVFPAFHDGKFQKEDKFEYLGKDMPWEVTGSVQNTGSSIYIRAKVVPAVLSHANYQKLDWKSSRIMFDQEVVMRSISVQSTHIKISHGIRT